MNKIKFSITLPAQRLFWSAPSDVNRSVLIYSGRCLNEFYSYVENRIDLGCVRHTGKGFTVNHRPDLSDLRSSVNDGNIYVPIDDISKIIFINDEYVANTLFGKKMYSTKLMDVNMLFGYRDDIFKKSFYDAINDIGPNVDDPIHPVEDVQVRLLK
jgi:hypothetical protein